MKPKKECYTFSSESRDNEKKSISDIWHRLIKLDTDISERLNIKGSDSKKKVWGIFSFLGFYLIWIVVGIISIIFYQFAIVLILVISILFTILIILPIKSLINRCRPLGRNLITNRYLKPKSASFPSGHTFFATFAGLMIALDQVNVFFIIVAFILGILVGYSRIYLGVHYFSDVIFSYLLSILVVVIYFFILNLL